MIEHVIKFGITLVSFASCLLAVQLLINRKYFFFLLNRKGRYGTIDGLRGFLAISVFFHHFIITRNWKIYGEWVSPDEVYYQNYGKLGVAIFFMITGFLFVSKIINNSDKIDWLKLYESRIFRIMPLYVFAIIVITFFVFLGSDFKLEVNWSQLINQYMRWGVFHGSNINGFENTQKIIAGVEWTLKYEWLFYISLPIIAYSIWRLKKIGGIVLIATCLYLFIYPIQIIDFSSSNFILFAIGGITSYIYKYHNVCSKIIRNKQVSFLTCSVFFISVFYPHTLNGVHIILLSLFFILVVLGNDMFGLLSLKSSILLGEISYSIYLLHGAILYTVFTVFDIVDINVVSLNEYLILMPLIAILVVLFSSITYLLIERPCMNLGRLYYFSNKLRLKKRQ